MCQARDLGRGGGGRRRRHGSDAFCTGGTGGEALCGARAMAGPPPPGALEPTGLVMGAETL